MQVIVTRDDLYGARDEGTVVVLTGTETQTGDRITFGADARPAQALMQGVLDEDEALAEVEEYQVLSRQPLRRAYVARSPIGGPTGEVVAKYLPGNYKVESVNETYVFISGHDVAGWTLDDYVIPRLASGLIYAKEMGDFDREAES